MERLDKVTVFLKSLTRLGLCLIALLFVLQVLIGPDHILFPVNTVDNMIQLSGQLGWPGRGLVIAVLSLSWALTKR